MDPGSPNVNKKEKMNIPINQLLIAAGVMGIAILVLP